MLPSITACYIRTRAIFAARWNRKAGAGAETEAAALAIRIPEEFVPKKKSKTILAHTHLGRFHFATNVEKWSDSLID